MNPDYSKLNKESASDQALKKWQQSIPVNRQARRNQLSKYKYYLELELKYSEDTTTNGGLSPNKTDGSIYGIMGNNVSSWTVYGVRKNGTKFMIDNSATHKPKESIKKVKEIEALPITNNLDGQATIPTLKPIVNSHLVLPSQVDKELV